MWPRAFIHWAIIWPLSDISWNLVPVWFGYDFLDRSEFDGLLIGGNAGKHTKMPELYLLINASLRSITGFGGKISYRLENRDPG